MARTKLIGKLSRSPNEHLTFDSKTPHFSHGKMIPILVRACTSTMTNTDGINDKFYEDLGVFISLFQVQIRSYFFATLRRG